MDYRKKGNYPYSNHSTGGPSRLLEFLFSLPLALARPLQLVLIVTHGQPYKLLQEQPGTSKRPCKPFRRQGLSPGERSGGTSVKNSTSTQCTGVARPPSGNWHPIATRPHVSPPRGAATTSTRVLATKGPCSSKGVLLLFLNSLLCWVSKSTSLSVELENFVLFG